MTHDRRDTSFVVPLTAGLLLTVLVAASLFVFVVPTVRDPRVLLVSRCETESGRNSPEAVSRTTLWVKWKWDRDIRTLIRSYEAMIAEQKADAEQLERVCVDP
jgi:hypothetical protein